MTSTTYKSFFQTLKLEKYFKTKITNDITLYSKHFILLFTKLLIYIKNNNTNTLIT